MAETLKPCPFCRGPATMWVDKWPRSSGIDTQYTPACDSTKPGWCGALLRGNEANPNGFTDEAAAIAAWNRRATQDPTNG